MKKAVFIRLDKIGDLVCTMPVDQVPALKDWDITWVIAKGLSFIPEHAEPRRKYLELDKSQPAEARRILETFLREWQPDVAVSFQSPWWVNFILWKCRIRQRIGVLSKWDSFIFLNFGLRQRRSQALQHEADYNLDLVRKIAPDQIREISAPLLRLKATPQEELLQRAQLTSKGYVVVHPGMAGSAINWPTAHYIELIERLSTKTKVVLTGTPADDVWLEDIKNHFKNNPQVICLQNQLTTGGLLYVLEQAKAVYAPSTGVLHMAASLGTPVYGFYSPILVQTTKRWGARSHSQVELFTPDVKCPATHECLGSPCPNYPCMQQITPEKVLEKGPQ